MTQSARRVSPPGGQPAPYDARLDDGTVLDLRALAVEICRRYRAEYPDEEGRYGDAGVAWCVHDNQHLVNWAILDVRGFGDMREQVSWLAGVLEARDFPIDRLARDLDIAAEVVAERAPQAPPALHDVLRGAARHVRDTPSFL